MTPDKKAQEKAAPVKVAPVKAETVKAAPVKAAPVKTAAAKTAAPKTTTPKAASVKTAPVKDVAVKDAGTAAPKATTPKAPKSSAPEATPNPFRAGMRRSRAPEPATLVIFGVTGDLSRRKLLSAVFGLWQDGLLGSAFNIVGVGRQEMTDEQFRDYAAEALKTSKETDAIQPGNLEKFRELLYYEYGDFATDEVYDRVGQQLDEAENAHGGRKNAVFYLSTPPSLFEPISAGLGRLGLQDESEGWRRIIIEKPFGTTLETARHLNDAIHGVWDESQVYRIDHYLGKETVQNLMAIRFGNAIFEPIWNRSYVDHVQITAAEDLGLEGRAGYYEEAGIIRDMLQNHLMQLFTLVAMEPPVAFDEGAIRDEKVKVLRAVKPIPASQVKFSAVRGQYGPGTLAGERVPGYREEPGVAEGSSTPTFVAIKLEIENWRWQGVPFFIRTGKRLPKKVTEIAVVFKKPPLGLFPGGLERNVLAFRIQPDEGVSLKFSSKTPGQENQLREVTMDFRYDAFGAGLESPYSRLVLDAMLGDATLFPREDEVDHAWQLVSGMLEAWEGKVAAEFPNYAAGSWGPEAADELMGPDRRWRRL
ncbi:glucose-6-phosphate 1-dehydrogenase [Deinococcus sp. UYEF24]